MGCIQQLLNLQTTQTIQIQYQKVVITNTLLVRVDEVMIAGTGLAESFNSSGGNFGELTLSVTEVMVLQLR